MISTNFPTLSRGDSVGVVSTGFAVRAAPLRAGVRALEKMGYDVRLGRHVLARDGYLAGSDAKRSSDLRAMLRDPRVRAIWFSRGGYGTARILDALPATRDPKLLIGYSDLTALFGMARRLGGHACLYGPVVSELGTPGAYHAGSLRSMLAGKSVVMPISSRRVVRPGRAAGPLIGGNLSVLCHLLGTPQAPDFRNAVLFLEDTGEAVYRIDRMLTQLALSGALGQVRGVLLGDIGVTARTSFPPDRKLGDVLHEVFRPLRVPVVAGLRAGHVRGKWTLPIGGTARIDTRAGTITLEPRRPGRR